MIFNKFWITIDIIYSSFISKGRSGPSLTGGVSYGGSASVNRRHDTQPLIAAEVHHICVKIGSTTQAKLTIPLGEGAATCDFDWLSVTNSLELLLISLYIGCPRKRKYSFRVGERFLLLWKALTHFSKSQGLRQVMWPIHTLNPCTFLHGHVPLHFICSFMNFLNIIFTFFGDIFPKITIIKLHQILG